VTLTPSSTELVVAVGAADRLVGVDRYSILPQGIGPLPVVGDFLTPNLEAILKLKPDLVILDATQSNALRPLELAGIPTLSLPMHTIDDVLTGLEKVGPALGREIEAAAFAQKLSSGREAAHKQCAAPCKRKSGLFVLEHQPHSLGGLIAAGPDTYASELMVLAGIDNVLTNKTIRYPKVSIEDLVRLAPDVIIESLPEPGRTVGDEWVSLSWPEKNPPRIIAVHAPLYLTPGPRFLDAVAHLRETTM
jgi:iron complex transport system substrate-binding protein